MRASQWRVSIKVTLTLSGKAKETRSSVSTNVGDKPLTVNHSHVNSWHISVLIRNKRQGKLLWPSNIRQ
jgi:hypothetical protein